MNQWSEGLKHETWLFIIDNTESWMNQSTVGDKFWQKWISRWKFKRDSVTTIDCPMDEPVGSLPITLFILAVNLKKKSFM